MKRPRFSTLQIWAFRDILRRPMESLLMAAAVTSTIAIVGTLMLFPRAVYDTLEKLMKAAPSIVVRRVGPVGWKPLPVQEAVRAAKSVVGVISVEPRIWGIVSGPDGLLTAIGIVPDAIPQAFQDHLAQLPDPGQTIVGPGVTTGQGLDLLELESVTRSAYRIIGRLPEKTSIFTHDLVLLNAADARALFGLAKGFASDLVVDVFHEKEQQAILAELTAAFPWPVRCVTRRQSIGIYADRLNRSSARRATVLIPAILAICLLVAVNIRKSMGRQSDFGIMKAMGWTTGDIVRLQLYRVSAVSLPAAMIGLCLAFLLVYWPGTSWLGTILMEWETVPPRLYLDSRGALTVLLQIAGFVLAPVIGSALAPAVRVATTDVHELIEGAGR